MRAGVVRWRRGTTGAAEVGDDVELEEEDDEPLRVGDDLEQRAVELPPSRPSPEMRGCAGPALDPVVREPEVAFGLLLRVVAAAIGSARKIVTVSVRML